MVRWTHKSVVQQCPLGVVKGQLWVWQTPCGLNLGHGLISQKELTPGHPQAPEKQFQPIHDCILGADGVQGQNKPMFAYMPFSEHKEVPSGAPEESRDDVSLGHKLPSPPISSLLVPAITMPALCLDLTRDYVLYSMLCPLIQAGWTGGISDPGATDS